MKILYALALALILVGGALLIFPPETARVANCTARYETGEVLTIEKAGSCLCMDDVGCVWRRAGKRYSKGFSGAELCITAAL